MKNLIGKKKYNINKNIKSRLIKLINIKSVCLGIFKFYDAIKISKNTNVDLLELTKVKNLYSICKLIKLGKFEYLKSKRYKKRLNFVKKKPIKFVEKKMNFHLLIHINDYKGKIFNIIKFLSKGYSVKITISAKGRCITKIDLIKNLAYKLSADLIKYGNIDHFPSFRPEEYIFLYISSKKSR